MISAALMRKNWDWGTLQSRIKSSLLLSNTQFVSEFILVEVISVLLLGMIIIHLSICFTEDDKQQELMILKFITTKFVSWPMTLWLSWAIVFASQFRRVSALLSALTPFHLLWVWHCQSSIIRSEKSVTDWNISYLDWNLLSNNVLRQLCKNYFLVWTFCINF